MKLSIVIIILLISVGTMFSWLDLTQGGALIKFLAAFGLLTIVALVASVLLINKRKK